MRQLRIWFALFFVWLFVLYNVERLYEPINLASFVYVLAAITAIPFITFAALSRVPAYFLLVATIPLVVGLKAWFGYSIGGTHLPMTVTEIVAVSVTAALALQIGRSLQELRDSALNTLLLHLRDRSQSFDIGQADLYREVRRARKHRRPLALLAISVMEKSVNVELDRFTAELHKECVHNYVSARVGEMLSQEMKDCNVVSHHGEHFVTVVPEADRETAVIVADKLKKIARDKLGVELRVGLSLFPEEEVTFVQLLERAQSQLQPKQPHEIKTEALSAADTWPTGDLQEFREAL